MATAHEASQLFQRLGGDTFQQTALLHAASHWPSNEVGGLSSALCACSLSTALLSLGLPHTLHWLHRLIK
ncbi:hypothetical protein CesoFtcFv8_002886 [Champsocephalus esox]|uniref:Uncharacterized protein n=1 Tax=Champsocephalus esox TaxID=159716 RepID=A0AAN8CYW1_9TELE|nr:hypothetical protein CesoFtcFv8_002886 [Champsocephalus esox]